MPFYLFNGVDRSQIIEVFRLLLSKVPQEEQEECMKTLRESESELKKREQIMKDVAAMLENTKKDGVP